MAREPYDFDLLWSFTLSGRGNGIDPYGSAGAGPGRQVGLFLAHGPQLPQIGRISGCRVAALDAHNKLAMTAPCLQKEAT